MNTAKPLVITQGDPAGIGPEIIVKAFRDAPDVMRHCFVAGDVATLRRAARCVLRGADMEIPVARIDDAAEAMYMPPRCVPVLQLPDAVADVPFGRITEAGAGRSRGGCLGGPGGALG